MIPEKPEGRSLSKVGGKVFEKSLAHVPRDVRRLLFSGSHRYCPVCESHVRRFWAVHFGKLPRQDARCPVCDSLERHRLYWCFLSEKTDLLDGRSKKLLHVAPEPCLSQRLREAPGVDYLSADLGSPLAMVQMDLTDIRYPDGSFDIVLCSHVLEHIEADRKAIAEMFRVLRKGGWALLQVPIVAGETLEDPSARSPERRKELFGQHDHVRACGPDYAQRYEEAGFEVERVDAAALAGRRRAISWSLLDDMNPVLFWCRKP